MINKKFLTYLSVLLLASSSCSKELEKQPTDTFSDTNAFITLADVQLGTNGAYGRYGAYLNNIYTSALASDEAKIGSGNGGQGNLTYRYQYSSDATTGGDVTAGWGSYYSMIDQINRVLPNVATVSATTSEEPRRTIIRGQLLALRGIAHFGLLQMYAKNYSPADPLGVPALTTSDPLAKPARNTQGETMARIDADLADAKALLPDVTPASFSDTVMNKINIAAYQAKVALHKGDFTGAIAFSTEVINSVVKPLASRAVFPSIWTDASTAETLFRIRFATSTALGSLWTTIGGQVYIAPSDKLVATFTAADVRGGVYIGTLSPGDNFVNKYTGSSRGGRVVDMKAVRISEMYLIRAEAYAKQASPNVSLGAADLNLLRSARISGYTNEVFTNSADLVAAILQERFKELCFEGFRFFDLKRNNLPVQRLASDANVNWQTLAVTSPLFVFPIPASEILANPKVVQNPGY